MIVLVGTFQISIDIRFGVVTAVYATIETNGRSDRHSLEPDVQFSMDCFVSCVLLSRHSFVL
jgi:hypothetical protein